MVFSAPALAARRLRVAEALELQHELLLVGAGAPVPLPEGTDQTYPFRAHADYFYLTGLECPHGVVAFDPREPRERAWRSFVPTVTEDERVWEGRTQPPGEPLPSLADWLAARTGRPVVNLGAPVPGVAAVAPEAAAAVRERFLHARRPKDPEELDWLRRAADATAAGYAAIRERLQEGVTERSLQIELEAGFRRAGADRTGYGTIVGSGPNAAVLHFEPTPRAARRGEFVLIDAGAEVNRYVCDVTRTYVVGEASAFQRDLHTLVREVQQRAVEACRPGVEWKELHLRVAIELTAGLVDLGLLRGRAESLVERETHRLFYPHGLGHLVGLGVRDASGTLPGRPKDRRPLYAPLRTDLPLRPGYVITVEPGLYFIPPLLQDPARRERHRDEVAWDRVDALMHLGGVRIEDNVLVTADAPDVLTASIPKTLDG